MVDRAQSLVGYRPEGRPVGDFYPTPPQAIYSLLHYEEFPQHIWEPACGDGAISKILTQKGYSVYSSDLYDYGYGFTGLDFLDEDTRPTIPGNEHYAIITNPPFSLLNEFIARCSLTGVKFALLAKLQCLEGLERTQLLEETHLTRVWVFRRRLTLTRNGEKMNNSGMIAFAWFVWEPGYTGKTTIGWI